MPQEARLMASGTLQVLLAKRLTFLFNCHENCVILVEDMHYECTQ
jgi:hypothetical protein